MPIQQLAPLPPKKIAPWTLSHDQLSRILDLSEVDQSMRDLHEVVTILSNTGIRAGELRQLRWADIDFYGRKLVIVHTKKSFVSSVRLGPQTLRILELRREREPEAEYVLGNSPRALLVRVSRQFRTVCDGIGVSGVSLHVLRRTFLESLAISEPNLN
jgi:integrase